jgi:ribosome-binding factor A
LPPLRRAKPQIRAHLARATDLRHVPDLRFEIDTTFDRLDDARRLFADAAVRRDVEE